MNPVYEPTTLAHTILALVFYVIMAIFAIYSMLALYALIRYGRSKLVALAVALLYIVIASSFYAAAINNLNNIHF